MAAFTITAEESRKLNEEYEINDMLTALYKSLRYVSGNTTIKDAIEQLKTKTRFANQVEEIIKKNRFQASYNSKAFEKYEN
jgi:predicted restriction endonuclease